jgi:hypothetical protein
MSALSPSVLHDLADGRLAPAPRAAAEAALAGADEATRADWRFAVAWREQTRAAPLHALPPAVLAALRTSFVDWHAARATADDVSETPAGWLRRIAATLLTVSGAGEAAPAGVRGSPLAEASRQFTFLGGDTEVVLNACPRAGGAVFDVHGQIFPAGGAALGNDFAVQLLAGGRALAPVVPDEFGEFVVTGVPPGACQLVITGGECEILTPRFELSS